jgi:hypothetical protein
VVSARSGTCNRPDEVGKLGINGLGGGISARNGFAPAGSRSGRFGGPLLMFPKGHRVVSDFEAVHPI